MCSQLPNQVLKSISIIDSPGILSGEKQRISRGQCPPPPALPSLPVMSAEDFCLEGILSTPTQDASSTSGQPRGPEPGGGGSKK